MRLVFVWTFILTVVFFHCFPYFPVYIYPLSCPFIASVVNTKFVLETLSVKVLESFIHFFYLVKGDPCLRLYGSCARPAPGEQVPLLLLLLVHHDHPLPPTLHPHHPPHHPHYHHPHSNMSCYVVTVILNLNL